MPEQFKFTQEQDQKVNALLAQREEHLKKVKELEFQLAQVYLDKSDSESRDEQRYVSAITEHPIENQIETLIQKEKEEIKKIEFELAK